jgi:hypothetical protein
MSALEDARRELRLRARHAFGHGLSRSPPGPAEAHIESFLRELERFIEAKLDDEAMKKEQQKRRK